MYASGRVGRVGKPHFLTANAVPRHLSETTCYSSLQAPCPVLHSSPSQHGSPGRPFLWPHLIWLGSALAWWLVCPFFLFLHASFWLTYMLFLGILC